MSLSLSRRNDLRLGRELNTAGDGFLVMFDGPQRTIRCAMGHSQSLDGSNDIRDHRSGPGRWSSRPRVSVRLTDAPGRRFRCSHRGQPATAPSLQPIVSLDQLLPWNWASRWRRCRDSRCRRSRRCGLLPVDFQALRASHTSAGGRRSKEFRHACVCAHCCDELRCHWPDGSYGSPFVYGSAVIAAEYGLYSGGGGLSLAMDLVRAAWFCASTACCLAFSAASACAWWRPGTWTPARR